MLGAQECSTAQSCTMLDVQGSGFAQACAFVVCASSALVRVRVATRGTT